MTRYHLQKLLLLAVVGLFGWLSPSDALLAQQTKTDLPSGGEPNITHRVLRLSVRDVKSLWHEENHTLYPFFFNTKHPDMEIL